MGGVLFFFISCADVTPQGARIHIIESQGSRLDYAASADKLVAKHDCQNLGFVDAKTSLFPPSYDVHENEIHAALRNRAAKMGANVLMANFYQKPATGIALLCSEEALKELPKRN